MNEVISNIKFEDPWLLLLLLPVPVYIYYLRTQANNKYVAFKISNTSGFKDYVPAKIKWMRLLPVLRITAVVLIIIAIARPQTGFSSKKISSQGIDIMLSLEVSPRMYALDFSIFYKVDS